MCTCRRQALTLSAAQNNQLRCGIAREDKGWTGGRSRVAMSCLKYAAANVYRIKADVRAFATVAGGSCRPLRFGPGSLPGVSDFFLRRPRCCDAVCEVAGNAKVRAHVCRGSLPSTARILCLLPSLQLGCIRLCLLASTEQYVAVRLHG
jgi:hypothetical protein